MSKARNAHAPWWGGQTMTHRQAAATPSPTALNKFFYCPLCSCIALIDRTTTTYYVLATASMFKAPCSESFSFFSFLAPFSFFHVTVTVTVTVTSSGTAPCDPVPRARALCIGGNICSHQKRRMPCFFPFRRPGPRFPNSPQSERGKIRAALGEAESQESTRRKRKRNDALRVRKRKRASHTVWGGWAGKKAQRRQFSWTLLPTSLCALSPPGGDHEHEHEHERVPPR